MPSYYFAMYMPWSLSLHMLHEDYSKNLWSTIHYWALRLESTIWWNLWLHTLYKLNRSYHALYQLTSITSPPFIRFLCSMWKCKDLKRVFDRGNCKKEIMIDCFTYYLLNLFSFNFRYFRLIDVLSKELLEKKKETLVSENFD